jgi:Peptidase A4 family
LLRGFPVDSVSVSLTWRVLGALVLSLAVGVPAVAADVPLQPRPLIPVQALTAGKRGAQLASANWGGYALISPTAGSSIAFTHVIGSWKVPSITCDESESDSSSAFWVGLGGFTGDAQMEQIGTWADCDDVGPASYFGWYELAGGPALSFALNVRPGDTMTASVSVTTTNQVTMTLKDVTRKQQAVVRKRVPLVDLSSAEWMAEAPTDCESTCSIVPIANFGKVSMSNLEATADGPTGQVSGTLTNPAWLAAPIEVSADASTPGTCTPLPTSTGTGFSVAWVAAAQPNC